MLLVYLSLTGNIRNFVSRLGMDYIELNYSNPLTEVDKPFIVIAPTYDDDITDIISEFIEYKNNINHLQAFVGSGDMNYDKSYAFNARDLSVKYSKPLVFKFEKRGTDDDIVQFKKEVDNFEVARTK